MDKNGNSKNMDNQLGDRLRFFRRKLGLGLKALAHELRISIQQLQKYETGINKIPASLLYKVSQLTKIPIGHFFPEPDPLEENGPEHSFNILLIEDNLEDELVIKEAIDNFPIKTDMHIIREAEQAVAFLKELVNPIISKLFNPNIVILELHMGKDNGLDILKTLKHDRRFNTVPVIILTERADEEEAFSTYRLQAGGLVVKAPTREELKQQMRQLLTYWAKLVELPSPR